MPTYGYRCEVCENTFEVFQKVGEKPISNCPSCGGRTTRVFYPVGIIFKGSGFYKTDYRSQPEKPKSDKQPATKNNLKNKDNTDKAPKKPAQEKAS